MCQGDEEVGVFYGSMKDCPGVSEVRLLKDVGHLGVSSCWGQAEPSVGFSG